MRKAVFTELPIIEILHFPEAVGTLNDSCHKVAISESSGDNREER